MPHVDSDDADEEEKQTHAVYLDKLKEGQLSSGKCFMYDSGNVSCICLSYLRNFCQLDSLVTFKFLAQGCDADIFKMTVASFPTAKMQAPTLEYAIKCFDKTDESGFTHEANAQHVIAKYLPVALQSRHIVKNCASWRCPGEPSCLPPARKRAKKRKIYSEDENQTQKHVLPFCTGCIMVTEYATFGCLADFVRENKLSLSAWRELLFQAAFIFYEFMKQGLVHKDAHDGNWAVSNYNSVGSAIYHVPELKQCFQLSNAPVRSIEDRAKMHLRGKTMRTRRDGKIKDKDVAEVYGERLCAIDHAPRLLSFDFGYMCSLKKSIAKQLPARHVTKRQKVVGMNASLRYKSYDVVYFAACLLGSARIRRYMPWQVRDFLQSVWLAGNTRVNSRQDCRPRQEDFENDSALASTVPLDILRSDFFKPFFCNEQIDANKCIE